MQKLPKALFFATAVMLFTFFAVQNGVWFGGLRLASSRSSIAASVGSDDPAGLSREIESKVTTQAVTPEQSNQMRISLAYEEGRRAAMEENAAQQQEKKAKDFVMMAVSLILLLCGVAVVMLQRYDANQKHWGYATLGTILGFWLR
jgi:hypothetical protein